jgi:hypothetical protein
VTPAIYQQGPAGTISNRDRHVSVENVLLDKMIETSLEAEEDVRSSLWLCPTHRMPSCPHAVEASFCPRRPHRSRRRVTHVIQEQLSGGKNEWLSMLQRYPYESCTIILTLPFPTPTLSPQATSFLFVRYKQLRLAHTRRERVNPRTQVWSSSSCPLPHHPHKRRRLPKSTTFSQHQRPTS